MRVLSIIGLLSIILLLIILIGSYFFFSAFMCELNISLEGTMSYGQNVKKVLKEEDIIASEDTIAELIGLLRAQKVSEFNKKRKSLGDKYLDFGGLKVNSPHEIFLENLDLQEANLSKILFYRVYFSGSNLRNVTFYKSYLAIARFYIPVKLESSTTTAHQTLFENTDFKDAILKDEGWRAGDGDEINTTADFSFTDISKAILDSTQQEIIRKEGCNLIQNINNRTIESYFRHIRGEDIETVGTYIKNPLSDVSQDTEDIWEKLGLDMSKAKSMKAIRIDGRYGGANSKDFVNQNPNTILVIGEDFFTHGDIYSVGPIITLGSSHFMGNIYSASWIWFSEQSFPRGIVFGKYILCGPHTNTTQGETVLSPVAHGTFGLEPATKKHGSSPC